jgi:hypothetical protein
MTDFDIVVKQLHGFETADEIAEYLQNYGITAEPMNAKTCALTKFVEAETGATGRIITTVYSISLNDPLSEEWMADVPICVENHTEALKDFVNKFDSNFYPSLVEDGYEWADDGDCDCPSCVSDY